jgi:hypothetical protein
VTAACLARPDCRAVVFAPAGRDGINTSLGTLKGTPGMPEARLLLSQANSNPRTVLLVREGTQLLDGAGVAAAGGPAAAGGLSAGAIAGIAVGAAAAGLLAAAALGAHRRRRRQGQGGPGGSPSPKQLGPPLLPIADKRAGSGMDALQLDPAAVPPSPGT